MMLRQRRLLRKDKFKGRIKIVFIILVILLIVSIGLEYIYFNFVQSTFISPLAKTKLSKLTSFEDELAKKHIPFSRVVVNSDGSYTVNLIDNGEVILSSKKDIGSQLASLQLMLTRLTIEGKKLKVLDFRFDIPVVSF
jgi:hypothetical protein